jgi:hypothetical protein
MPIDIIKPFLDILEKADKTSAANGAMHSPGNAAVPLLS